MSAGVDIVIVYLEVSRLALVAVLPLDVLLALAGPRLLHALARVAHAEESFT